MIFCVLLSAVPVIASICVPEKSTLYWQIGYKTFFKGMSRDSQGNGNDQIGIKYNEI